MPRQRITRPHVEPTPATPMAFVRVVMDAYERRGMNPSAALAVAQITPAQLAREGACITARQFERVSSAAMQELDDEGLGAFSRRLPWGSYGMLARASLTAPSLSVALRRWCRHHGLLTDDIRLAVRESAGQAVVRIEEQRPLEALSSPAGRAFCLMHLLRNAHGLACCYVESRIALSEVSFPFPAPPHREALGLIFQHPAGGVRFDAAQAEIHFDARYLCLPIRRDEHALRQHPEEARSAAGLAHLLHISSCGLHRQLRDEGATLQALKDEQRSACAQELLARGKQPIKQIAGAVGFRNDKSFARAFRNWTGQAPGEFRRARQQG